MSVASSSTRDLYSRAAQLAHQRPLASARHESRRVALTAKEIYQSELDLFRNSEGKFQCPTCGKSYVHFKHLKRHNNKHTGYRPHVCNLCRDSFCRSDVLKRHYERCLTKVVTTGKTSSISRVPKKLDTVPRDYQPGTADVKDLSASWRPAPGHQVAYIYSANSLLPTPTDGPEQMRLPPPPPPAPPPPQQYTHRQKIADQYSDCGVPLYSVHIMGHYEHPHYHGQEHLAPRQIKCDPSTPPLEQVQTGLLSPISATGEVHMYNEDTYGGVPMLTQSPYYSTPQYTMVPANPYGYAGEAMFAPSDHYYRG